MNVMYVNRSLVLRHRWNGEDYTFGLTKYIFHSHNVHMCNADDVRRTFSYYFYLDAMGGMGSVRKIANTYMWRNCTLGVAGDFVCKASGIFHIFSSSIFASSPSASRIQRRLMWRSLCECGLRLPLFFNVFFRIRFRHLHFVRHTKHLL